MTKPESSGGLSKVAESSLERAAEVGRRAEFKARSFLDEYSGDDSILSTEQADAIAAAEREKAAHKFLEERIAGLHNDKTNREPGITAIVTFHVKQRAEEVLGTTQGSFLAPSFEDLKGEDGELLTADGELLMTMRLHQGWYEELTTGIRFFAEATCAVDQRVIAGGDNFGVSQMGVVRIEGDSGEYWQNPHLNLDGSRK